MSEAAVMHQTGGSQGGILTGRLGSVLAVAPLGTWVAWHLWENLYAWQGAQAWSQRVTEPGHAVSEAITLLIVFVPLIIHTVWGIRRLAMTRPNGYRFFGNLKYLLQRLSAIGLFFFIGAHVYLARIHPAFTVASGHEHFADLAREMRTAPTLTVYILGILGTAYHLSNGVYTASFIHGIAASPRAGRWMQVISVVLFILLLTCGWGAVWGLYRAGGALPPGAV